MDVFRITVFKELCQVAAATIFEVEAGLVVATDHVSQLIDRAAFEPVRFC
jgi:hypothetical protein